MADVLLHHTGAEDTGAEERGSEPIRLVAPDGTPQEVEGLDPTPVLDLLPALYADMMATRGLDGGPAVPRGTDELMDQSFHNWIPGSPQGEPS